jgi:hypothetical protein
MKKVMSASLLAVFALVMLLPVTGQVNAASVNHSTLRQGPSLPGGGGHVMQGPSLPGGGGHVVQGPSLPGGGGH